VKLQKGQKSCSTSALPIAELDKSASTVDEILDLFTNSATIEQAVAKGRFLSSADVNEILDLLPTLPLLSKRLTKADPSHLPTWMSQFLKRPFKHLGRKADYTCSR
jgi:hypothetical protein